MSHSGLCDLTLRDAAIAVRSRRISPVELTQACLKRIQERDSQLNSFTSVPADEAIADAFRAESEVLRGNYRGPLHGIPIAIKDIIDIKGQVTTAASRVFLNNVADADADVVAKLREAGAVIIGKNNLHEFAYGGSAVISHFGSTRNPLNPAYITGGSSSGSAAAVAAGFCFAAIGTDTAGSIRLPAAYCGVVGLKPTYGLVSVRGVIPLSLSYDHVGPIARTVTDVSLVLDAIRKKEIPSHSGSLNEQRIGVARHFFFADLEPETSGVIEAALNTIGRAGVHLREVKLRIDEDRTVFRAEAYAYHRQFLEAGADQYHPQTLQRILSGQNISTLDYQRRRRELDEMRFGAASLFQDIDLILTPTVPIVPPSFAQIESEPSRLRPLELLMLRNTRPFNVLGLPAITIPCGRTGNGLSVGLQIAAAPQGDELLLNAAVKLEELFNC
jgi:aspartyl-tRNA(Asn)/glutamyl-tRNA(Gln) amidotransferase subunit A